MQHAIQISHLKKSYGRRNAIDDLSFELACGSRLCIFGPNGAGKTTLLRLLCGLERPDEGSIVVCGLNLKEEPARACGRLGLISHQSMLYNDLSAQQNLVFFAQLYGVEDANRRAKDLLEMVGLSKRRTDELRSFSRGMLQRMSIARALVHDPDVLLLDEPYTGLDASASEMLDNILRSFDAEKSFVMVSHDLEKAFGLCSHAMLLSGGKCLAYESKENLDFDRFGDEYRHIQARAVF